MRFAVVAHHATGTSAALAALRLEGVESAVLTPAQAVARLGRGDVALARLDVLRTVDGIEPGVWALDELEAVGVRVLNRSSTLRAAHDKLITARVLEEADLPHPPTQHIWEGGPVPDIELPIVVKPRFGSWGRDVVLCPTLGSLAKALEAIRRKLWYAATGALLQELVPVEFTPEYGLGSVDVHARTVSLLTGRRVLDGLAEVV
jgi:glutathione synthase/RimK-type ligase-like ATP-grasp enzyme